MVKYRHPDIAVKARIALLPPSHGAIEYRERAALRRYTRDALRLAHHLERKVSPEADEGCGYRHHPMQPALEALTAVTMLTSVVERLRGKLVALALRRGATWNEIGRALGVSKQAAHARYRNLQPPTRQPRSPEPHSAGSAGLSGTQ
ncbi:MAG: hypothetical protein ACT4NP_14230 [Pseudonocardiales bacterium]